MISCEKEDFFGNCPLKFFVDGRPSGTIQHFKAGGGKIASYLQQMISKAHKYQEKVVESKKYLT